MKIIAALKARLFPPPRCDSYAYRDKEPVRCMLQAGHYPHTLHTARSPSGLYHPWDHHAPGPGKPFP